MAHHMLFSTSGTREWQSYHTHHSQTVRIIPNQTLLSVIYRRMWQTAILNRQLIYPFQVVWTNNLNQCLAPWVLPLTHNLPQHELGKCIHLILSELQIYFLSPMLKVYPTEWQNNINESNGNSVALSTAKNRRNKNALYLKRTNLSTFEIFICNSPSIYIAIFLNFPIKRVLTV